MHTLVCIAAALAGSPPTGGMAPPPPELPSYGGLLVRTLLALILVIALVWILLRWGLRRLTPGARLGSALRVVARQPVDGRRSVVLVEAAGRYLLLGVGEGSVTLLTELERDAVDQALQTPVRGRPRRFADVLRATLRRPEPEPLTPRSPDPRTPDDDSTKGSPP